MSQSTPEVLLECRELKCGFPSRVVLSSVSLKLSSGSILGLLGPNGAGKSTHLRTLAGTLKPLGGEAIALGRNLAVTEPKERASLIGYVPQEEATEFAFTVLEIVAMGRIPRSNGLFESKQDEEAAEEALRKTDAIHLMDRRYVELSGGERQRVLVARALAQQTRILLLDEPTSHLDLAHQVHLVRVIRSFASEGGAVLIALHDLNLAGAAVDTAMVLSEGGVALEGPIGEILASPTLDQVYRTPLNRIKGDGDRIAILPTFEI